MNKKKLLLWLLFLIFLCIAKNSSIYAGQTFIDNKSNYLPYLQIGGTRFFNTDISNYATSVDLFLPIWQQLTNLLFIDGRFYDRSSKPFEGNLHLGYRHFLPEQQQIYGIYGAFDRKRTSLGNYFNQLTIGGELWWNSLFLGGNFYQPIGTVAKLTGVTESVDLKQVSSNIYNIWITDNKKYEKAMGGVDFEIGYEFVKGLTGYVGGYYFNSSDTDNIVGPKAKLTYDWSLKNGKRVCGLFDKLGLETGINIDNPRGTLWYLSANLRIGLLPSRDINLQDVSRHMVDLVRRDVDIIVNQASKKTSSADDSIIILNNDPQQILDVIEQKDGPNIIFINSSNEDNSTLEINIKDNGHPTPQTTKKIVVGNHLKVTTKTGQLYRINIPRPKPNNNPNANIKGTNGNSLLLGLHQPVASNTKEDVVLTINKEDLKTELLKLASSEEELTMPPKTIDQNLKSRKQAIAIPNTENKLINKRQDSQLNSPSSKEEKQEQLIMLRLFIDNQDIAEEEEEEKEEELESINQQAPSGYSNKNFYSLFSSSSSIKYGISILSMGYTIAKLYFQLQVNRQVRARVNTEVNKATNNMITLLALPNSGFVEFHDLSPTSIGATLKQVLVKAGTRFL